MLYRVRADHPVLPGHFDRAGRETRRPLRLEEIVAIAGQYGVSFG